MLTFVENFTLETDSWLFIATVGATAITIGVLIAKVFTGDTAIARRGFRRDLNEGSLRRLYSLRIGLTKLLENLTQQMHDAARTYEVERYRALEWYEWATASKPENQLHWRSPDEHTSCQQSCLEYIPGQRRGEPSEIPSELVTELTMKWNDNVRGHEWDILGFLDGNARSSFLMLMWCFLQDRDFDTYKLPRKDSWLTKRINWQHNHLYRARSSVEDSAIGRILSVKRVVDPELKWLDDEIVQSLWDLAELRRDVETLLDYLNKLASIRVIDRLNKAWE